MYTFTGNGKSLPRVRTRKLCWFYKIFTTIQFNASGLFLQHLKTSGNQKDTSGMKCLQRINSLDSFYTTWNENDIPPYKAGSFLHFFFFCFYLITTFKSCLLLNFFFFCFCFIGCLSQTADWNKLSTRHQSISTSWFWPSPDTKKHFQDTLKSLC